MVYVAGAEAVVLGRDEWRRIDEALRKGRVQLVRWSTVSCGWLVHHECPMRLQLEPGGAFESAAQWLPMAMRIGPDLAHRRGAVAQALEQILDDPAAPWREPVACPTDGQRFRAEVARAHLGQASGTPAGGWSQIAAVERLSWCASCANKAAPALGVRIGLEHAGERLTRIDSLFEAGLDHVLARCLGGYEGVMHGAGPRGLRFRARSTCCGLGLQVGAPEGV